MSIMSGVKSALGAMGAVGGAVTGAIGNAAGAVGDALGLRSQADKLKTDVTDFIGSRWTDQRTAYSIYHQNIWRVLLYYVGEIWIAAPRGASVFSLEVPDDDWTPQPKINRFAPAVDAVASNFSRVPEVEAVPKNRMLSDDIRMDGICRIATACIQHFFSTNGFDGEGRNGEDQAGLAGQLFVLAGTVFTDVRPWLVEVGRKPKMKTEARFAYQCVDCDVYETDLEEAVQFCPQCNAPVEPTQVQRQVPVMGGNGQPETEPIRQWKVRGKVGNPLYALPRVGSTSMNDTRYFFWAQRRTIDEIWELWQVEASPDNEYLDGFSLSSEQTLQYYYAGFSGSTAQARESALVVEIFIEPGKVDRTKFPEGAYAVYINGEVKHVEPWPFPDHPFTKGDFLQMPTMFFARSMGFDIANIQSELKDYESLIKLHAMVAAVDSIVVDANTVVDEITGRADKIIKWRSLGPGSKEPHRMKHGSLDTGVYAQRDSLHMEIQNISGAVSVYRGEQPGSVTAASAIAQLRGQAEMMFSKPNTNWRSLWRETGRKAAKAIRTHYTFKQICDIVGPGHEAAVMDFINCDLDELCDFMSSDHGLPRTRDDRRQEMMELYDRGALDVNDANVREKLFELFGETGMFQSFNKDATRARAENRGFLQGKAPMFLPDVEDLAVHFSLHAEQIKSLEFDTWPEEAKVALLDHTMATKQALLMIQMEMSEMGMPGPLGPGGDSASKGAGAGAGAGGGRDPGAKGAERGGMTPGAKSPKPQPAGEGGGTGPANNTNTKAN
jgi:hypothetical protein